MAALLVVFVAVFRNAMSQAGIEELIICWDKIDRLVQEIDKACSLLPHSSVFVLIDFDDVLFYFNLLTLFLGEF